VEYAVLNCIKFATGSIRLSTPSGTIFVTPRKWWSGSSPVVLHDAMARWMAVTKFSQRAYPRGSCNSQANQNSTVGSSGWGFASLSNWLCIWMMSSPFMMWPPPAMGIAAASARACGA
jgi:hypothetical protein